VKSTGDVDRGGTIGLDPTVFTVAVAQNRQY